MRTEDFQLVAYTMLLCLGLARALTKKGGAVGPRDYLCDDLKVMDNMNWWYDWGVTLEEITERSGCKNLDQYIDSFIPMLWGNGSLTNATSYEQAKFVLGFNEPNHVEQSNLTAEQAAELWPEVEIIGEDKLLVSPSASGCGGGGSKCHGDAIDWFDAFFHHCNGCRVDYIATHAYHCSADETMDYLKTIYNRYGKEIWLTEFACPKTTDPEKELEYMKAILPRLEAASFVFRYSWFSFRILPPGKYVTPAASLFKENSSELTTLGQFYNDYAEDKSTDKNGFVAKVIIIVHYIYMAFKKLIFQDFPTCLVNGDCV